jgi:transcriptional regulator with XRE-family HTH domain
VTSAEYKTIREACGLSQQGAAGYHNVALRTVQHWEEGRNGIPAGMAEAIRRLDALIERGVIETIDLYQDRLAKHETSDPVALVRYRTAESYVGSRPEREGVLYPCHGALIGRTRIALERIGATVCISFAE